MNVTNLSFFVILDNVQKLLCNGNERSLTVAGSAITY